MKRYNLCKIGRVAICLCLAFAFLAPINMEAARKRKRTKATTTATTKKKTTRRSTATGNRSVTQATRDVAISASQGAKKDKEKAKGSQTGLAKISVEKPDLDEIRTATLDPSGKYYFPKLMAKYQRNDTTMTQEEFRYLYLGYMFQEDYDPYRTSPYSSMTDSLRLKTEHSKAEIDTIRKYAEKALLDNPFDLRQMSFLVHVLKERRKDMSAKIWEYRLEHLLGAIKSTGTGDDEENAWYVIYPMHEYDMVQLLGYEAVDMDYIEPGFDYLKVQPDGTIKHRSPAKGFYFNIQVPQQQYELKHPEEEDEGDEMAWQE
ncbi:MAG: DUF4919 domain-containing protein [Muribaculaceae bacterium]|nr:DUF4919 domain-containing protein [Muribaculaceae bacterium]